MYESYFGFSATPFNLNPDPNFYFESRGHGHALSYLKFGVYQGEGFVVVTGEIGAGKTTLVRTLLAGVDPKEIVAAQIVSTQLDAGDLLRSVALAFGIAPKNLSKAELIATIEAFLTELVLQKKRALLVVDEAQNLNLAAIEELRMLSNFQLGNHALLQSFLIGQPELRALLTSKPMEQLRQRVIASCHLGPMDRNETEAYVRHRLARVGWTDRPSFEPAAFDQIFEWTGGVPRRVNLLCNRLLLATFLQSRNDVDADSVRTVAREVLSEVGESASDLPAPTVAATHGAPLTAQAAKEPAAAARPVEASLLEARARLRSDERVGPLLFVADCQTDDVKLSVLMHAMKTRKGLPEMFLLRLGDEADFAHNQALQSELGVASQVLSMPVSGQSAPARIAHAIVQVESVVDQLRPSCMVVAGVGDAILATALVCQKRGVRLVLADAGRRGEGQSLDVNSVLIEHLAEIFYAADPMAYEVLMRSGLPKARLLMAGNLLVDSVRFCAQPARPPKDILSKAGVSADWLDDRRGFGVVALSRRIDAFAADEMAEHLSRIRQCSLDIPLLWPIDAPSVARLDSLGLRNLVEDARIALVDPLDHLDQMALIHAAALVLADSQGTEAVAAALRVPCVRVDHGDEDAAGSRTGAGRAHATVKLSARPDLDGGAKELDGHAGERMAEHLTEWLLSTALVAQLVGH